MTKHALITAAAAIALVAGSTSALGQGSIVNIDRHNITEPTDWGNLPINDETILISQMIHQNREQIALNAQWVGPGPGDMASIIAGENDNWLEDLRAEVRAMGLTAHRDGLSRMIAELNGSGDWSVVEEWFAPAAAIDVGSTNYGARGHTVLNLWPVVDDGSGNLIGSVPYTFAEGMLDGYIAVINGSDDPADINAFGGVANALAVMLILEQELPILFFGFSPNVHTVSGTLIFDSVGEGTPTPAANNSVNRTGRAPAATDAGGDPLPPTQITHNSWGNFPSVIRSFGFALGLDWEQRHPMRDVFIQVNEENLPPDVFPVPAAPGDGLLGPGIPTTFTTLFGPNRGPLFWDQTLLPTNVPEIQNCGGFAFDNMGFDLDSIMLLGPFDYTTIEEAYTIREPYRYIDIDGDGTVDTTRGGPDDRMFNQPVPVFFSDCDIATLTQTYSTAQPWFFGEDETCPYDINRDNVQDGFDAVLFLDLFANGDPATDLVFPFGTVDEDDLAIFNGDLILAGTPQFFVQTCVGPQDDEIPDGFRWFYGNDDLCTYDLNNDEIQDGRDAAQFFNLFLQSSPQADIAPPFGVVDQSDIDAFQFGAVLGDDTIPDVLPFFVQSCQFGEFPVGTPWFYGNDDICEYDLNNDEIQDGRDALLFVMLHAAGDPQADIAPPFGIVDTDDLDAFQFGAVIGDDTIPDVLPFTIQACQTGSYPIGTPWFYGINPDCPHDINFDEVIDGADGALYEALFAAGDPRADLVIPWGVVDSADFDAFFNGAPPLIDAFVIGACEDNPLNNEWFYGRNPLCPWDINQDDVQDGQDIQLYIELFNNNDPRVDLIAPFGSVGSDDFNAFQEGDGVIEAFVLQRCNDEDLPDDFPWFYGKNPDCPHDVNEDLIQDAQDRIAFFDLWNAGDFAADLVPPLGQITPDDFFAFFGGDPASGIEPFTPGFCTESGPPGPGSRPGGRPNPT